MFVSVFASIVALWLGGIEQGWVDSESSRIGCEEGRDVGRHAGDWIDVCTYLSEDNWRLREISNEHVNWYLYTSPSGRTSDRIRGIVTPTGAGDSCEVFQFYMKPPRHWYYSGGEVRAMVQSTGMFDCNRRVEVFSFQVIAFDPDQPEVACLVADLDGELLDTPLQRAQQIAEEFAVGWDCSTDETIQFGNEQQSSLDEILDARRAAR